MPKRKGTYTSYSRGQVGLLERRFTQHLPYSRARHPKRVRPTHYAYARKGRFRRSRNYRTGGFLGIELKFLDTAWNGVAVAVSTDGASGEMAPSTGCTNAISIPAQGDGESQRDGRKYTVKSVWLSGVILTTPTAAQTAVDEQCGYWLCLVQDTQTNGAKVVSENVFINPATSAQSMVPQPLRNLQNSKRFRVLAHQFIYMNPVVTGQDAAGTFSVGPGMDPVVSLSWKGNMLCDSTGTTADVASASDNSISLIGYSSSATFTPVFHGKCRVRFVG